MITRDCRIYLLQSLEERKVTFGLFQVKNVVDGIIEKNLFHKVSCCISDFNMDS